VLSATVFNIFNRCRQQRFKFLTDFANSAYNFYALSLQRCHDSAKKGIFKNFLALSAIEL
jgi:hypothetical protein